MAASTVLAAHSMNPHPQSQVARSLQLPPFLLSPCASSEGFWNGRRIYGQAPMRAGSHSPQRTCTKLLGLQLVALHLHSMVLTLILGVGSCLPTGRVPRCWNGT